MKKTLLFLFVLVIISCSKEEHDYQEPIVTDINLRHEQHAQPLFNPCDANNLFVLVDFTDCIEGSLWECAVQEAIAAYDALGENIGIGMTLITDISELPDGEQVNITIDCDPTGANTGGGGGTFLRNTPADVNAIFIETNFENNWPCNDQAPNCCQMQKIVMHELGHALSFAHTEGTSLGATWIPGTPMGEDNSIFNVSATDGWCNTICDFTPGDLTAMEILYPCERPNIEIEGPTFLCHEGENVTYCISNEVTVVDWDIPNNMSLVGTDENCVTVSLESFGGFDPIRVTVANADCCEFEYEMDINTFEDPNFDLKWNGPVCLGDVVRFSLLEIPEGQNLQVTDWEVISGGLNIMASNSRFAVVEALSPGTSTICATARNECGNEKRFCRNVTIQSEAQCGGDGDIPNPK